MIKGKFITIDGPNGVGKSSIIERLKIFLSEIDFQFIHTKEVTNSRIGKFINTNLDYFQAKSLACIIAADRFQHIESTIKPSIESGVNVISDRYFPSSLVYQNIDGCSIEFINSVNTGILIPDISIIVNAKTKDLQKRIVQRIKKDKYEIEINSCKTESQLFVKSIKILKDLGWTIYSLDNSDGNLENNANLLFKIILNKKLNYE